MTARQLGTWRIVRSIHDATTGEYIDCVGHARLDWSGKLIRYDETVTFRFAGRQMNGSRTYFYRIDRDTIAATFADGAFFFKATLRPDGTATAIHHCGSDVYIGTIDVGKHDRWQTCWDVSGGKALRIMTHYSRPA